jgi:hypothetical protein
MKQRETNEGLQSSLFAPLEEGIPDTMKLHKWTVNCKINRFTDYDQVVSALLCIQEIPVSGQQGTRYTDLNFCSFNQTLQTDSVIVSKLGHNSFLSLSVFSHRSVTLCNYRSLKFHSNATTFTRWLASIKHFHFQVCYD